MYFLSVQLKVIINRILDSIKCTYRIWTSKTRVRVPRVALESIELICIDLSDDRCFSSQNQSHQMLNYREC